MIDRLSYNSRTHFISLSAIFLTCLALAVVTSLYWIAALPFAILLILFGYQQPKFIFFILIFSLPWSIEYSINNSLATDLPDEPLMWVTAALFLGYFLFYPGPTMYTWRHPLVFLLLAHVAWIAFTVPFSTDLLLSVKFLLAKGWYITAFVFFPLLIFRDRRVIRLTALLFLISMLIVTLLSIFRHSVGGFRFSEVNDAVQPFFRNHVNYSAMLVCTIPLLVAAYQLTEKYSRLIGAVTIVVLAALFFSYARGAWLALIVGAFAYELIRKGRLLVAFIITVFFMGVVLFWIKSNDRYLRYAHDYKTTIFHKDFEQHLIATYRLKDVSTAERFNRWIAGVRMLKGNWLTGYGPNTFYYNYKPYSIPAFRTWVSNNRDHSTVHNYFLLILTEQGVPGLLFFLILVGAMLFYSEKLYQRVKDKFYKVAAMACGVLLVMIMVVNFLSDLIETDKVGSLFFLCLASLVAIDINTRGENVRRA